MTETDVCVLSGSGPDRATWLRAWETCGREPFAHPAYVELFSRGGEEAHCVVSQTTSGIAILPIILRPIHKNHWTSGGMHWDAVSPYGYGGPYGHGDADFDGLWVGFAQWMTQNKVVSMFGRLALDAPIPRHSPPGATFESDSYNVIVDLTRSSQEQWRHYEHKVRKNIKKALRANLHAEVKDSFTDLHEFWQLYESTMDRRNASSWYHFSVDFFSSLTERLSGSYLAAEVRDDSGQLISAELVLCSDRRFYSFLGGTLKEAFPQAPNDLLKHAVIDYGRESGRTSYVLGGGYLKNDGILRYKMAFDPAGNVPFTKLEMIADQATYDLLVSARLTEERLTSPLAVLASGFFPAYRSPVLLDSSQDVE